MYMLFHIRYQIVYIYNIMESILFFILDNLLFPYIFWNSGQISDAC